MNQQLTEFGYQIVPTSIPASLQSEVLRDAFAFDAAGSRCLLDIESVAAVARQLRCELAAQGLISSDSIAIQAIAFDKTPSTNWKVTWHQDLMFPMAGPFSDSEFTNWCVKDGINFARPSRRILEQLTAVRFHFDECDDSNGPLRVASGTHTHGIVPSEQISNAVATSPEVVCTCPIGAALLMKPLLLHASSKANAPKHRRVLHLVFHSGITSSQKWHRQV